MSVKLGVVASSGVTALNAGFESQRLGLDDGRLAERAEWLDTERKE